MQPVDSVARSALTALQADPLSLLTAHVSDCLQLGRHRRILKYCWRLQLPTAASPLELFWYKPPLRPVGFAYCVGCKPASFYRHCSYISIALPVANYAACSSAGLKLGSAALDYASGTLLLSAPPALPSLQIYLLLLSQPCRRAKLGTPLVISRGGGHGSSRFSCKHGVLSYRTGSVLVGSGRVHSEEPMRWATARYRPAKN